MTAIPKCYLIHNAELINEFGDEWAVTERNSAPLKHVRIEPSRSVVRDVKSQEVALNALLFFDCRNSHCTIDFALEGETVGENVLLAQRVKFGNRLYTVKTIEAIYDNKKLHHYEIGLS